MMAESLHLPPGPWPGEGDRVVAADGARLGRVAGLFPDCLSPTHVVVEQEGLLAVDWYVPLDAVAGCTARRVRLGVSAEAARRQGWGRPPVGFFEATEDAGFDL